jgi:predicted transcriptional regulator
MKTTVDYLNEAKTKLGLSSDYQAAKWLGVSTAALARYQKGQRTIDDYAAMKIADALGKQPIEVIALANMERETISERKEFWRKIATAGTAGALIIDVISTDYEGIFFAGFVGNIHYALLAIAVSGAWKTIKYHNLQRHAVI